MYPFIRITPLLLDSGVAIAASAPAAAEDVTGKVIDISDADTIEELGDKQTITVRLEGIDAPESAQAFGRKAKNALAVSAAGKNVTVRKTGDDRYGRTQGVVLVDSVDVNAKLV